LKAACESMVQLNIAGRDAALAVGAHAATDITGFGLAGHLFEMADGSKTTIVLDLKSIPLIDGLQNLDVTRHRTRASKTNREYTIHETKLDGTPPALPLEVFYDAQTSGGMLIAVPAERAPKLCEELKARGALTAVVIAEVIARREFALWLK
jgi:selenide, water dikinase